MSNSNAGIVLGLGWICTIIVWILIGIGTFNWIGVESFGRAILWIFVWHIFTTISYFIIMAIIAGLASLFE